MTYEPLHHKYRPQRFADVVGQSAVVKTLVNAIRMNRIAPAYLFCGPRGTGKTSSARILAKSLNCVNGPTSDPCNRCEQCVSITSGSALDVIEIDAASHTGVDNIRELIERAQFAPVSSRYKVYVIDECHMLSNAAFNALLKTLEEPPERVVFVLATTDPQRVLPTVISRCQRFDYRRIPLPDMVSHLSHIAQLEGIPIRSEAVELVAQLSQGGLRDAESLLDQLSLLEGEVTIEQVWDLVGAVPERALLALVQAIQHRDPEAVLTQARHLLDHGKEPLALLQNLVSFYRDLLLAQSAPQRRDLCALTQETWEQIVGLTAQLPMNDILTAQRQLKDSEPLLRHTTQPRLWLEISLLDLLQKPDPASSFPRESAPVAIRPQTRVSVSAATPPQDLPRVNMEPGMASTPARLAPLPPSSPEIPPSQAPAAALPAQPSRQRVTEQWDAILGKLAPNQSGFIRSLGHIVQETPEKLVLGFASAGFTDKARTYAPDLSKAIKAVTGSSLQLEFVAKRVTGIPPSQPPARSKPDPYPSSERGLPKAEAIDTLAPPSTEKAPDPSVARMPTESRMPTTEPSPFSEARPSRSASSVPAIRIPIPVDEAELKQAAQLLANHFGGRIAEMDPSEYPDFLRQSQLTPQAQLTPQFESQPAPAPPDPLGLAAPLPLPDPAIPRPLIPAPLMPNLIEPNLIEPNLIEEEDEEEEEIPF